MIRRRFAATLCILGLLALPAWAREDPAFDFSIAKLLAEEGQTREALRLITRAIEAAPSEPLIRVEHARMLLQTGDLPRAMAAVDAAREMAPEDAAVLAAVAEVHLSAASTSPRSLAAARSALEALSRRPDADPRAMVSLAQLYLQQGEEREAVRVLRELEERMPGNRLVTGLLTEALVRGGELEAAMRHMRAALSRDPEDLQTRLTLAQLQQEEGRYSEAATTLAETPQDQLEAEEMQRRLALALVQSGELESGRVPLQRLVEGGSAADVDRYLYGRVLSALGEGAAAIDVLRPLMDEPVPEPAWIAELAGVLEREGSGEEAADLLAETARRLRASGQTDAVPVLELERAELLRRMESWPELVRSLSGRVAELPEGLRAPAATLLLEGLRNSGQGEEALELVRARRLPLGEAERLTQEAETLHRVGRFDEAERLAARLEQSADAEQVFLAGRLRTWWDEPASALPLLERAAAAHPRDVTKLFWLANAYYEAGRIDDSERALRQLLAVQPDSAMALNFLGYLLAEADRDLEEARRLTAEAVRQDPANGAYVDSLGWAYFRLGRLEEARRYLERAARLLPGDATVLEHLGDLYRALGDHRAARRAYLSALAMDDDNAAEIESKLARLNAES